jgi:predicted dehydrogenase
VLVSSPLRVGLVGAGRISHLHLPAYLDHDEVELVAVCDVNDEAARGLAAAAGIDAVFRDAATMIAEAGLDAVDICSGHDQHLEAVLAAAAAGKHVLVEKAMGRSLDECREMVSATAAAGVTFMVAQNLRYGAYALRVKQLVDDGELGAVLAVRCDGAMDTRSILRDGDWMLDGAKAGGGTLITFSTHIIDLLRYFLGDVVRVSGVCRTVWDQLRNGAEDYACATLEFASGAIGSLFSTWTATRAPAGVTYVLYGERGSLYSTPPTVEAPIEQVGRPLVSTAEREARSEGAATNGFVALEPAPMPSSSSFVNEILHFAECCRTGEEPVSSGRDNFETMKVVFGIYEAARTGQVVELASL